MKKIFVLTGILLLVFSTAVFSQSGQLSPEQRLQLHEKKADSAISNREVKRMKELFELTPQQEQSLYKAGIIISQSRRAIFKSYWKQDGFIEQMAQGDKKADSLYQSVIGEEKYKLYKEMVRSNIMKKEAIMRQRATADSLTRKNKQP